MGRDAELGSSRLMSSGAPIDRTPLSPVAGLRLRRRLNRKRGHHAEDFRRRRDESPLDVPCRLPAAPPSVEGRLVTLGSTTAYQLHRAASSSGRPACIVAIPSMVVLITRAWSETPLSWWCADRSSVACTRRTQQRPARSCLRRCYECPSRSALSAPTPEGAGGPCSGTSCVLWARSPSGCHGERRTSQRRCLLRCTCTDA